MAPELREALAGLCRAYGWSYGVIWRVDRRDPRLLTVEDSYCKEEHRVFLEHLLDQINMVGKGILGEAVLGDKHGWIYRDAYPSYSSMNTDTGNPEETTVIVSLPSFGVAQFGSTKKVPESLDFVDQAKCLIQLIAHKDVNFTDHNAAVASTSPSGDAYSFYKNNFSSERRMANIETLRGFDHASNGSSQLSSVDLWYPDRTTSPFVPVTSSFVDTSTYASVQYEKTPFRSRSSMHFTNHTNASGVDSGGLLSPLTRMITNSGHPGSSVGNHNTNNWNRGAHFPTMEQEMLSVLGLEGLPNLVPMNSNFPVPQANTLNQFSVGTSTSRQCGLQDPVIEAPTLMASKDCLPNGVTLSLPLQNSSCGNTDYIAPSIAAELLKNPFTSPQILSPRSSMLAYKVDQAENSIHLTDKKLEQFNGNQNVQMNGDLTTITDFVESDARGCNMTAELSGSQVDNSPTCLVSSLDQGSNWKENSSASNQLLPNSDFFDGMELDHSSSNFVQEYWDDILMPGSGSNLCTNLSEGISELNTNSVVALEKSPFLGSDLEQLLDAIVGENGNRSSSQDSIDKTARPSSGLKLEPQLYAMPSRTGPSIYNNHVSSSCIPSISHKSNILLPHCNPEGICGSPKPLIKSSGSWIDDSCSMNTDNSIDNQQKSEDNVKVIKKRARPGESTRPRPKDRQQIQDRVKELREIVPNGAKCSIDALLDRTIKHMLFMQSVTKYADKLKQSDEPKMIVEESGVVLKENFGSGSGGGATWAYEVAGQTMVCPIIVEDLTPTGQMLVEMLCEDRGFFLEIADIIRGFGLTILKGVMEVRECKIWARFIVEANRDVTRMDIFLSLVQLLQQTSSFRSGGQASKLVENGTSMFNYQQSPLSIPINTSKATVI